MPYRLTRLAVFRGVIVVEGFSTQGVPFIEYDDPKARVTSAQECWPVDGGVSFKASAIVGGADLEHSKIALLFPDGTRAKASTVVVEDQMEVAYRAMFARFYRETERGGRLLEIGSRARSGIVHRHLFSPNVDCTGIDIKEGRNVDVVGDAHELRSNVKGQFDFAFSNAVFEHLLMPWKVAIELGHVLKTGGYALIASHAAFPLHDEPWDFWRFSKNAWRGLFNEQTGFEIVEASYAGACSIATEYALGGPLQGIDLCKTYILSACLVRKTNEPRVEWSHSPSEVYDLAYSY